MGLARKAPWRSTFDPITEGVSHLFALQTLCCLTYTVRGWGIALHFSAWYSALSSIQLGKPLPLPGKDQTKNCYCGCLLRACWLTPSLGSWWPLGALWPLHQSNTVTLPLETPLAVRLRPWHISLQRSPTPWLPDSHSFLTMSQRHECKV